ncbi:aminotransferase class V-fold PLP-dependent enzyme [Streptomyces sp. HNM0575]|uniref:kynureninase n=1 Tax=Streptomyces sp. HNM0575 TaxID=2716338 RepID=UPI00145FAFB4|nr:aminotransferase class V-fold PLP-dependent enzyme [Streptomyces sp. HNM0575]NLU76306.1 aminotransferase class V-fold PLP-dependent enzyme [Streptomyces sp. HNM0575]
MSDAVGVRAGEPSESHRGSESGSGRGPGRGPGPGSALSAGELDALDELAFRREDFVLDGPDGHGGGTAADSGRTVYLDGNSLGALPRSVPARLAEVVEREWGRLRIRSWSESGWWSAPERIGDRIAPLVGAGEGRIVVGDSTSVNVFKAVVGAVRLAREEHGEGRDEILVDAATFPTDGYIARSAARMTGATVRAVPVAETAAAVGQSTAAVLVNHVDYRTGELHDLAALTEAVHRAGARAVWDVCHSAGALPVELDARGADFAVGCTYKYLNGGPGSPAFLYVRRELQDRFDSPLPGWTSHADPFAMADGYVPGDGAARGRVGTPDILSMLALEEALRVWDGVGIASVRAKSLALTDFFLRELRAHVPGGRAGRLRLRSLTPEEHERRGSQISLLCEDASSAGAGPSGAGGDGDAEAEGDADRDDAGDVAGEVMAELHRRGVVGDFRRPGVLRFGFTPLYTSFADAGRAARVLAEVVHEYGQEAGS